MKSIRSGAATEERNSVGTGTSPVLKALVLITTHDTKNQDTTITREVKGTCENNKRRI